MPRRVDAERADAAAGQRGEQEVLGRPLVLEADRLVPLGRDRPVPLERDGVRNLLLADGHGLTVPAPRAVRTASYAANVRLRTLSEAECYARCYGGSDDAVTVVRLVPADLAAARRVLSGEEIRRLFEDRLDRREPELDAA